MEDKDLKGVQIEAYGTELMVKIKFTNGDRRVLRVGYLPRFDLGDVVTIPCGEVWDDDDIKVGGTD